MMQKKYYIMVGRRQPAHFGHLDCIQNAIQNNATALLFTGSANNPQNPNYNPIENPLSAEQVSEQMQRIMHKYFSGVEYKIIPIQDFGNIEIWVDELVSLLGKNFPDVAVENFLFHYFAKESGSNQKIANLDQCVLSFKNRGIESVQFEGTSQNNNLSSTKFRQMNIDDSQFQKLPDAQFLTGLAIDARQKNNCSKILENLPITMMDLTLLRLNLEHNITAEKILEISDKKKFYSINDLIEGMKIIVRDIQLKNLQ